MKSMAVKDLNRWTPYEFRNGLSARNRIVVPPMASGTASSTGAITSKTFEHYHRLSQSGAGITFVEYSFVHLSGRSEPNQLGIDSDSGIDRHRELAFTIEQSGSLPGIQLVHGGGKASPDLTGGELLGVSPVKVPTKGNDLEVPRELSLSEIDSYQNWYLRAALRAAQAGYKIIELHGAHGYGLNQWLSPLTNHRNDEYGGSLFNRSRMLLEIASKIRKALPGILLGVRIPGTDHFEGGLTPEDMLLVARNLQAQGVDFLDVSSGIGGWKRPRDRTGEGYLLPEGNWIQNGLEIPVIGVGGIETGSFIDKTISQKSVAFTAVGRKILKDPMAFHQEVLAFR
jgi:NADPH2 dehydrogenase